MLIDKLFELKSFKRQYEALLILSVCRSISALNWEYDEKKLLRQIDWNNILGIASALSYSDKNEHLDAALRISQTVTVKKSLSGCFNSSKGSCCCYFIEFD